MKILRNFSLLGVLAPLALAAGCGGGSSSAPGPSTPLPTPTFVPPAGGPTAPAVALPAISLRLPEGQAGILSLKRTGGTLNGELRVQEIAATHSGLETGVYPVSGVISAPTAFSLAGETARSNKFTLTGNLPNGDTVGDFSFKLGDLTGNGLLLGPNFSTVPSYGPAASAGDLQFSDFTARGPVSLPQFPFDFIGVTPTGPNSFNEPPTTNRDGGGFQFTVDGKQIRTGLKATGTRRIVGNTRRNLRLEISLASISNQGQNKLVAGQTFNLAVPGNTSSGFSPAVFASLNGFDYLNTSGTLVVKSIGPESVAFELRNVTVANYNSHPTGNTTDFPNDGKPLSSFVINGTFQASGLPTLIINQ